MCGGIDYFYNNPLFKKKKKVGFEICYVCAERGWVCRVWSGNEFLNRNLRTERFFPLLKKAYCEGKKVSQIA